MIVIISIVFGVNAIKVNIVNENYNSSNSGSSNGNLLPEYIKKGITLGGVTGTLESLDTSDATATAEDIVWGKTAYVDGKKIIGTYLTLGMLEIGDYVDYNPDSVGPYTGMTEAATGSEETSDDSITQENLNWRVLSINYDGTVELISATPTSQYIYLSGAKGYNNGVYLLNDVATSLYSNKSLEATARSLTIEDIERGMTEAGLEYIHSYSAGSGLPWGQTKTYTSSSYRYYPDLYAQENGSGIDLRQITDPNSMVKEDGIKQSDSYYSVPNTDGPAYTQASKSLTVKQTYYNMSMNSSYYKNSTFYNLIHGLSGHQWLASRYVSTAPTLVSFGLRIVDSNYFPGTNLFYSYNYANRYAGYLRPVVSLKSTTQLTSGDGSSTSPYELAI